MYQPTTPCPKCGNQNLRGTWVCAHCGFTLIIYCPHCRAANVGGSSFCQSCGKPLTSSSSTPAYPTPAGQQPYSPPQQPQNPQNTGYGANDYSQGQQQYPQGYPPPYNYRQQPANYGGFSSIQASLNEFVDKLKLFVGRTNPILLSALVVLIVGMTIFLILAFQLGWIKTDTTSTENTTVADKTPPIITMVQVKAGASPNSAIISWVTNEYSSSQIQYGLWPNDNTNTPIQNDPRTGQNTGLLVHEVGISNLLPKSTYVYRVISFDKAGNKAVFPPASTEGQKFNTTSQ
jgi:hypothetical protein